MLYIPYPFKRCTKCGNEYLPTANNFKKKRSKEGLEAWCRSCLNTARRKRRADNPEKTKEEKKRYRENNADKIRLQSHLQRLKHIEAYKERDHQRYWSNPQKARDRRRDWYYRNPEVGRGWRKKNPQQAKALGHRLRVKRRELPQNWTGIDWTRCLNYWNNRCAVCGRPQGLWHTLAADHWIPISDPDCPGTIPGNIIPLCHGADGCNNSKGNRNPETWLISKFGSRNAKKKLAEIQAYFQWLKEYK